MRLQVDLVFRKHELQFYPIFCPTDTDMIHTGLALNFVRWKRCKSIYICGIQKKNTNGNKMNKQKKNCIIIVAEKKNN